MKYKIKFSLSRTPSSTSKSSATGTIEAKNFEEMAKEIKRWLDNDGVCEILEVIGTK